MSAHRAVEKWIPAFPTDQVRGLKAHGNADFLGRTQPKSAQCVRAGGAAVGLWYDPAGMLLGLIRDDRDFAIAYIAFQRQEIRA